MAEALAAGVEAAGAASAAGAAIKITAPLNVRLAGLGGVEAAAVSGGDERRSAHASQSLP